MNDDISKRRLGRGLAALIGEMDQPTPVEAGRPGGQCRSHGADRIRQPQSEAIRVATSMKPSCRILPAPSVSTVSSSRSSFAPCSIDRYEIIAGERRWRAAQLAGLIDIPVIVRDVDDKTALEIAIVENVQRADLNPLGRSAGL